MSRRARLRFLEELEGRTLPAVSLVADINPGRSGSSSDSFTVQREATLDGVLFFTADDGTHGSELWKSDGTANGSVMVKDIQPGSGSSFPTRLTDVKGTLFFVSDDGVTGRELWKSNGTPEGTVLVKDIVPGSSESRLNYLVNVNGTLYFTALTDSAGYELWKSDGTEAGTMMVKDIYPGTHSAYPRYLTNVDGTLFFNAEDNSNGKELWKSDGTPDGTVMVKAIFPAESSSPHALTNVNGTLYFVATGSGLQGRELWKSNGTEAGTVLVKDIHAGSAESSDPTDLTNVNGTLFFTADDGTSGREVWKTNGTEAGTVLVKDIAPGFNGSDPKELTAVGDTLFFSAKDQSHGQELWKSDGTAAGTELVRDIRPVDAVGGNDGSYPESLTAADGTLFFSVDDHVSGDELWKSDGTAVGTVRVADIVTGSSGSSPNRLLDVDGRLFFRASDADHGEELWFATDGGNAPPTFAVGGSDGTVRLLDPTGNAVLNGFRPLDTESTTYTGVVQVALGDFNADDVPDLLVAAASLAGQQGLDPAVAGRVLVYDGATLASGTIPPAPIREFVPFAISDGPDSTTAPYINGLNIATADVNADGQVDLIAGTRGSSAGSGLREVGRLVVVDGRTPAGTNNGIGSIVKPFGPGYEKGVVVATGDLDGDGSAEIGVTRGGPVASPNPATQQIKLKAFRFDGSALDELDLTGTGSPLAPFGSLAGPANGIRRDGRVAFVDANNDGSAELIFTALDPLTDPANGQVRVAAYSVNTATGLATVVSTGPDAGTYITGSAVVDHAIAHTPGTAILALLTQSASPGVVYLDPLTGVVQPGGFALSVLTGGITLAST